MSDISNFAANEEELTRQKQQEFHDLIEERKKQHSMVGVSIDPGNDPMAREAMTQLLEQNIEQAMAGHTRRAIDSDELSPDALARIRSELREQVNALFERNRPTSG